VAAKPGSPKAKRKTTRTKAVKKSVKARKATQKKKSAASGSASAQSKKTSKTSVKAKKTQRSRKPKSPLTKAQLKEFRQLLLEKRRSLIGDMTGMQNEALGPNRQDGSGDLSTMPDHPANIASDNYEHEFMLGLLENERALLKEIDEALERIDNGTYGICQGTGKPIGLARLRAKPWAKYCIEYARMVEKGLVRPGEQLNAEQDED